MADKWILQQAETRLVWVTGALYPVSIFCTVYEKNQHGEKKLIEQRELSILPKGSITLDQFNAEITKAERRGYDEGLNAEDDEDNFDWEDE
jgi:hypothetical protein